MGRDLCEWMSAISDGTSVTAMSIPGTHDSHATQHNASFAGKVGSAWVVCQGMGITDQLNGGARYIDLRVGKDMVMCHGNYNLDGHIWDTLGEIREFLKHHPTETVLVSVKSDGDGCSDDELGESVKSFWQENGWFNQNRWPTLGEVRGKGILLRRFGGSLDGNVGIQWNLYGNQHGWNANATWKQQDNGSDSGISRYARWDRAAFNMRDTATLRRDDGRMYFTTLADSSWDCGPSSYAAYMDEEEYFPFTIRDIKFDPAQHRLGIVCFDFFDGERHGKPIVSKNF